jgi:sulfide:quinone oxidoreductase
MLDRRQFLAATALVGTGALVWPGAPVAQTAPISTNARIIIIGAGAAGTALCQQAWYGGLMAHRSR